MLDRWLGPLESVVTHLLADRVYLRVYPCTVISQNADGTLELLADDPNVLVPSGIPIRYGLPGVSAKVQPKARVDLGFEGGDPSRPIAALWDNGNTGLVSLSFAGGASAVARAGDSIDISKIQVDTSTGKILPMATASIAASAGNSQVLA